MAHPAISRGTVDWSCENPGMYLRESLDGPFLSAICFARTCFSPHGRGHAAILFLDPRGDGRDPALPNVCVTDNEPLARYLLENFISRFGQFQGLPALTNFRTERGWDFVALGDQRSSYTEQFQTERGRVTLTWDELGDAYMVHLPRERSWTGQHEMYSLFVNAGAARALVYGHRARGRPFPRDYHGRASSTAFLAFSETWVRS